MSPEVQPPMPTGQLVRLRHVQYSYDIDPVLVDIDLNIEGGGFMGIVGPSGSGKTSLLRVLLGVLQPTSGTIERRPGLRFAYVPQVETINWNFPITVREAVLMARPQRRWRPGATTAESCAVGEALDRLGIGELADRHIRQLSGGQQQRVFLARALLAEPDLLLLDEPTSGVDVRTRHVVLHLLAELHAAGLAIVLTTHDLNGIAAHLPTVVCLNREILGMGAPRDVLRPDVLEQTYGAPMDVLEHAGLPLVVDRRGAPIESIGARGRLRSA